ncbi:MAG: hypothetical protein ABJA37_14995 [Ferruginibacter sp.]
MKYIKLCLAILIASIASPANAQKKIAVKATGIAKFKAPKLQTFLGSYKDSAGISATEATNLIATPLKIYDAKKNEYTVSSYQFLYKKVGVTEDEKTEKTSPITTISSDRFKVSPLPAIWVSTIQQQVKPGEEFFFFDVIAKDAQGRVMYASNLKLTIL